mmetsp:Transcript_9079/g.28343  ORF Transcript_9079/g.28343 Transcript_9079/m.28343 type:complete len:291 (-) Transcript_9079:133-1005(-)
MSFLVVLAQLTSCLIFAEAVVEELYSTNAICKQNNCINPLFPGLTDLSMLQSSSWQCQSVSNVRKHLQFCEPIVNYDVAVPSPNSSTPLEQLVQAQEKAAVTMYFYHLSGMHLEPTEHKHPEMSSDKCVQAVWMMVCNTYFPKAEAGCEAGQRSTYLKPCKNVCTQYLEACDVRCCDEGTQCVFDQTVSLAEGGSVQLTGYTNLVGPSHMCTGGVNGAHRRAGALAPMAVLASLLGLFIPSMREGPSETGRPARGSFNMAFAAVLVLLAVALQGCDLVGGHGTAAWLSKF